MPTKQPRLMDAIQHYAQAKGAVCDSDQQLRQLHIDLRQLRLSLESIQFDDLLESWELQRLFLDSVHANPDLKEGSSVRILNALHPDLIGAAATVCELQADGKIQVSLYSNRFQPMQRQIANEKMYTLKVEDVMVRRPLSKLENAQIEQIWKLDSQLADICSFPMHPWSGHVPREIEAVCYGESMPHVRPHKAALLAEKKEWRSSQIWPVEAMSALQTLADELPARLEQTLGELDEAMSTHIGATHQACSDAEQKLRAAKQQLRKFQIDLRAAENTPANNSIEEVAVALDGGHYTYAEYVEWYGADADWYWEQTELLPRAQWRCGESNRHPLSCSLLRAHAHTTVTCLSFSLTTSTMSLCQACCCSLSCVLSRFDLS